MTSEQLSVELGPVGAAYASCRRRIADLVVDLDAGAADRAVPCCPAWSVRDVAAHLAGVVDDVLAGRLEGVATDPWTAAQVDRRRGRELTEIVDEWQGLAPQFERFLDAAGPAAAQAVADVVTHEHDIRQALAAPGARDSDAVAIGLDFIAPGLRESARQRGIPVPGLRTPDGRAWSEPGDGASVTAPAFELVRASTGRRSAAQLRALDWDGDVDAVLAAFTFGPFVPAERDILE